MDKKFEQKYALNSDIQLKKDKELSDGLILAKATKGKVVSFDENVNVYTIDFCLKDGKTKRFNAREDEIQNIKENKKLKWITFILIDVTLALFITFILIWINSESSKSSNENAVKGRNLYNRVLEILNDKAQAIGEKKVNSLISFNYETTENTLSFSGLNYDHLVTQTIQLSNAITEQNLIDSILDKSFNYSNCVYNVETGDIDTTCNTTFLNTQSSKSTINGDEISFKLYHYGSSSKQYVSATLLTVDNEYISLTDYEFDESTSFVVDFNNPIFKRITESNNPILYYFYKTIVSYK